MRRYDGHLRMGVTSSVGQLLCYASVAMMSRYLIDPIEQVVSCAPGKRVPPVPSEDLVLAWPTSYEVVVIHPNEHVRSRTTDNQALANSAL
jgi:hypothetical protein